MNLPTGGIAFFDSGIGGLTVLNACMRRLKKGVFYYLGDNLRAPYGNLPPQKVKEYVREAFDVFSSLHVKAAVVACNTATALCIDDLRQNYSFPIVGTEPAVLSAAKGGGTVWSLSTRATYNSDRYKSLCARAQELYPQSIVQPIACDGLAGAIEGGLWKTENNYDDFLPKGSPTSIVLGCTHYVFLKKQIEGRYGCSCYDGNEGISARLQSLLPADESNAWDGRPLFQKKRAFRPLATTFLRQKNAGGYPNGFKSKKTNVCLCKRLKTNGIQPLKGGFGKIFFLGKSAAKNANFYKRMFAF